MLKVSEEYKATVIFSGTSSLNISYTLPAILRESIVSPVLNASRRLFAGVFSVMSCIASLKLILYVVFSFQICFGVIVTLFFLAVILMSFPIEGLINISSFAFFKAMYSLKFSSIVWLLTFLLVVGWFRG
jgi:hypothetical protein